MGKENEITVLNINKTEVMKRLRRLGAKNTGSHAYKRIESLLSGRSGGKHSWIRVRTDGKTTVITLKEILGSGRFTPMNEYEVKVDNFREAVKLLSRLLKTRILYFENNRIAYLLNGVTITIDKWPEIPAFLEIEGPDMKTARSAYSLLQIKGKLVGNAPIHKIYGEYGLGFREVMKRNREKLKELLK